MMLAAGLGPGRTNLGQRKVVRAHGDIQPDLPVDSPGLCIASEMGVVPLPRGIESNPSKLEPCSRSAPDLPQRRVSGRVPLRRSV